jgi:hypothetical protein
VQYSLFNLTAILGIILVLSLLLPIVFAQIFAVPDFLADLKTILPKLQT